MPVPIEPFYPSFGGFKWRGKTVHAVRRSVG
jgi:hypothetical protein